MAQKFTTLQHHKRTLKKESTLLKYGKLLNLHFHSTCPKYWGFFKSRHTWRGENWLGEVLTKLREDLIKDGYGRN